ncbi:AhpD family alkylhydroperoxidase [Salsuginibacillus halophilus]|uniref:AhpD family alkylhydroperoxidase n=1 Tax=Salsuginibacillus halophilus TaxID=517424 RepID=A0A2P8HDX6_9BACI|nr:carboxymuconolactone decarboxylase family protein [Salsuginibacillus halophilus]PSL44428.1 AhpD family alkylhydroperoxidase [Salsuginibacillus halophilus]
MSQEESFVHEMMREYKEGVGHFEEQMPKFMKAYHTFTEHSFEAGEVSAKQKQLIALALSVFAQDEYCMVYHTKGALDHDCTESEIYESLAVAGAFGGGMAVSQAAAVVKEAVNVFSSDQSSS